MPTNWNLENQQHEHDTLFEGRARIVGLSGPSGGRGVRFGARSKCSRCPVFRRAWEFWPRRGCWQHETKFCYKSAKATGPGVLGVSSGTLHLAPKSLLPFRCLRPLLLLHPLCSFTLKKQVDEFCHSAGLRQTAAGGVALKLSASAWAHQPLRTSGIASLLAKEYAL